MCASLCEASAKGRWTWKTSVVPQHDPSSLGLTSSCNVTIEIPLYIEIARMVGRSFAIT
jgi:hypothetical protein